MYSFQFEAILCGQTREVRLHVGNGMLEVT